ncbi:aromatic ring-hydroxylating dioxygenase subunit alpha [Acidimicrobiales bacterium]|nr:aromatic ring-hydroxylating dioxygenase subunit alpha [Acidimicrobiales bacterium]
MARATESEAVQELLENGVQDRWYPVLPSHLLVEGEVKEIRRFGYRIALWRDDEGVVRALEDYCPHRGAPLSAGRSLGDRLQCPYHWVEVRHDGVVVNVPGSPGCGLDGRRPTRVFHATEAAGAIFLYNSVDPHLDSAPELVLPEELISEECSHFLCYVEWKGDYRDIADNVMDPAHGAFLHRVSHSMSEGTSVAEFSTTETETGYVFAKNGQLGLNFDWTEFGDTGVMWMRLEIPYPPTGGPTPKFGIVGMYTPAGANGETLTSVFFWRVCRVQGWQRDVWLFLYRNRLEARHWAVLEQDRNLLEIMEPDGREQLYNHDLGLVRLRRHLRDVARAQVAELEVR